jgi:hypothetical protein
MGTISDKLMRIINTKEDIRRALISKGYDVPTSIPFKEYAKMISDLPCKVDDFPKLPGDVTRWHFGGLTNEMMAAMDDPRIEDADHKGRFLSFKNFAWKGMSGVGGYGDENYQTFYKFTLDDYVFIASPPGVKHMNFTFRVTGLQPGNKLTLAFFGTTNTVYGTWDKDGIYTVDADIVEAGKPTYFYNGYGSTRGEFTIEILPLYPGFILGDGVDDFAVTEKELNFKDTYTVYTAFIPFQNNPTRNMILCGADSKKTFSMQYSSLVYVSFIAGNNYYINADFVNGLNLFACKRNGNNICIKNLLTNKVVTGTCGDWVENAGLYYLWKNATYASFARAGIAGQIIDNGHFTTDEEDENILNWHKKQYPWLFPDQAWTVVGKTNEDEDRATIANITGNGNNLVLSNFGFSGNSGYGLYNIQKFTNWNHVADRGDIVKNGYSVTITNSKITGSSTNYNTDILYSYNSSSTTIIFKVTGLVDGQKIFLGRKSVTDAYVIDKDGIYRSDYNIPQEDGKVIVGIGTVGFTGECNITIEQIPEYEGYLVTDGVDDRVQDSSFKLNKDWTLVGEWVLLNQKATNAGITKPFSFVVYNRTTGLSLFINTGTSGITIENVKSIKAICSDGRIYLDDWSEILISKDQDITSSTSVLSIGFNGTAYTQIAFKNLGIYNNQILSKDDCIKAYNYLQTLKSK